MSPVQAPPTQDPLDALDRKRLSELQYLSTFCPFSLNSKPCPQGTKCALKRLCSVRVSATPFTYIQKAYILTGPLRFPHQARVLRRPP